MKIVLLGATGRTGQAIINYLENYDTKGHRITAIVRDPSKLSKYRKLDVLEIVKADIFDRESMKAQIRGHDMVISTLGIRNDSEAYPKVIENVTEAMRSEGVKNIQLIGPQYHSAESMKSAWSENWIFGFFVNIFLKKSMQGHANAINVQGR